MLVGVFLLVLQGIVQYQYELFAVRLWLKTRVKKSTKNENISTKKLNNILAVCMCTSHVYMYGNAYIQMAYIAFGWKAITRIFTPVQI